MAARVMRQFAYQFDDLMQLTFPVFLRLGQLAAQAQADEALESQVMAIAAAFGGDTKCLESRRRGPYQLRERENTLEERLVDRAKGVADNIAAGHGKRIPINPYDLR